MVQLTENQNIVFQWFCWQFFEAPKGILKGWKNFLSFNLGYFSIFLLSRTLFSPWRRYQVSYGRGFDIAKYLEAFFSNLIFRILGAIIRIFIIITGLLIEILIFFAGVIVFFGWLMLPVFLIAGLIFGFRILF